MPDGFVTRAELSRLVSGDEQFISETWYGTRIRLNIPVALLDESNEPKT